MGEGVVPGDEGDVLQGAALVISVDGAAWRVPETETWKDERSLQEIVGQNPTILPGVVSGPQAVLEFPIYGMGRVDVLCVEQDGSITICEVKLRRNPEIRRQVLGQVLAYAAGLTAMSYDEVDAEWRARKGTTLAGSVLSPDADPGEVAEFQRAVASRLRRGHFRLILAVDELTDELRSTLGYLADHTDAEVDLVALELAYARLATTEVLIPRAWGATSQARSGSARSANRQQRLPVDEAEPIIEAAERATAGAGQAIAHLLERLAPRLSYLYVGDAARIDDVGCVLVADAPVASQPFAIRPALKAPGIRICFGWMRRLGSERLEALLGALEADPLLEPLVSGVRESGFGKRPLIPFDIVLQPGVLDRIIDAVEVALEPFADGEEVDPIKEGSFDPDRLHRLMAAIPSGRWTTYGELASQCGTKGMPLGSHIKHCAACPNAPRVLNSDGKPTEGFTRTDPSDTRTQRSELESEGVQFTNGIADAGARISGAELAAIIDAPGRPARRSAPTPARNDEGLVV